MSQRPAEELRPIRELHNTMRQQKKEQSPLEGLDTQCGLSIESGEGMLVGTIRESFVWKVGFELDLLKGGSKIREVGAAPLGTGALLRW